MHMDRLAPRIALLAGILGLGAVSLGGTGGMPPVARAATAPAVFESEGVLELLRPTNLVGDGVTPVDLYMLALNADGTPMVGVKFKLIVTGGEATEPVGRGDGLYAFTFTPTRTTSPGTATFYFKGKLPNKAFVERSWFAPVSVPRNRSLALAANPAQLTLGVDKTANVAFTFTGGDPRTLAGMQLALQASVGTLTNVTNLGKGEFNGLYTTPTATVPQVALVTAVDAGDPMRIYGAIAIPLSANVTQAVTGAPKTRVILKVGGREFGPVTLDSKGRGKVPVLLPPGATSATLVRVAADGTVSEAPLDLKVTETRRVALFPTVAAIPSDGRLRVPLRAMVVTTEGKPDENALVEFSVTAGTVSAARHEGGGIYTATFTPPDGNAAVQAGLTVKLADATPIQSETRPLPLVPVRATGLTLSATPPVLPVAATSLTVTATVTGPAGVPLPARTLAWSANGARLQEVKDLANGSYEALFGTTGKGPVEVTASVAAPATGNGLTQLLLMPSLERLPADGLSSTMLTLATLDEFGYPVPGVAVSLQLLTGDGTVPTSATTNAAGIAQVFYTAGRKNGFSAIDASVGDLCAGVSILQAPPTVTLPDLPTSSSAATRATLEEWVKSLAAMRVERE